MSRLSRLAVLAALGTGLPLAIRVTAPPAAAALSNGCTSDSTTVTCTYETAGEATFTVPAYVTSLAITAVGGSEQAMSKSEI